MELGSKLGKKLGAPLGSKLGTELGTEQRRPVSVYLPARPLAAVRVGLRRVRGGGQSGVSVISKPRSLLFFSPTQTAALHHFVNHYFTEDCIAQS